MMPTIPETGTVLRLEHGTAVAPPKGGTPCKGCGAGRIGLCRPAGNSMIVTVKNTTEAMAGDTVTVVIGKNVQWAAYFLAYFTPLFSLIAGFLGGYPAGG
jgi:positive regulator of sigma E activity